MTAKKLQKPCIIDIEGGSIRIAHPVIENYPKSSLAGDIAAGGTEMSVLDNNGFEDNDWFVVGSPGTNKAEEDDVNGAPTRGQSLTVTNTLKFNHGQDEPVNKIYERGIKIYGAATLGGAGTLIASVDAKLTPLADAVMIQWNRPFTEYTFISTDTLYAYYFVKFTDGTTDSDASDYIASTGAPANSIWKMFKAALRLTSSQISEKITIEDGVRWADECQRRISSYSLPDELTGRLEPMFWDFEMKLDESTLTLTENENVYSTSSLGLKKPNTSQGIISLRLGDSKPLSKIPSDKYDDLMEGKCRTTLTATATVGAVTLTVASNVEFADSGTLYIGSNTVTYTGKSGTTGFTGIPASGSGSIVTEVTSGGSVWQGVSPDLPDQYMIYKNQLIFNTPVDTDYVGFPVRIRFYEALDSLTEISDTTEVTFYDIFHLFMAARIEDRKGKRELALSYMNEFESRLKENAMQNESPITDEQEYYEYDLSVT